MNIRYCPINTDGHRDDIRRQVLKALEHDKVRTFGSSREVESVTKALKKEGKIKYVKVKDGGNGWELVK